MQVTWRTEVVANSDKTLELHGYRYFPRDAVRMELLRLSPKTASDEECPHGVQFYDVVKGADCIERAAWSYEKPKSTMQQVDHWVAFWEEGEIE